MAFERDFPQAKVVRLEENYRSTQTIIAASNAVISNNHNQLPKNLVSMQEEGPLIGMAEFYTELDEARWVADQMSQYLRAGKGTTAILYRTNAQARALEHALVRSRVPYHVFGGVQFYDRLEVRDALAAIRVAANPQDTLGVERLIKTFRKKRGVPLVAALHDLGPIAPADIIDTFLRESSYAAHLEETFDNAEDRLENILELRKFAATFENVTEFLEHVSLVQSTDSRSGGTSTPGVTLMTVHMAKGLEFDRVHIAGANEGTMPHSRSLASSAELEEERRLFYVAMTRARHELSISFVRIPSRFLLEIPEHFTEMAYGNRRSFDPDDEHSYIDVRW
jgi:DNA helicase-2/ATP-dependent DNA helicase PcrA